MKRAVLLALCLAAASAARAVDLEAISVEQGSFSFTQSASFAPSMSRDGRYVSFESHARLTPDDPGDGRDVYVFDRTTKKFARIRSKDAGTTNSSPSTNGNGRLIAYASFPAVPATSTEPRSNLLMMYDRARDKSARISLPRDREITDAEFLAPHLNSSGRFMVFTANGVQITPENAPSIRQVYLLDRYRSVLELVSQSSGTAPGNRLSGDPRVSEDGRFVAFRSAATNLADGLPTDSLATHLYLIDRWEWNLMRIDSARFGFNDEMWVAGSYDMDDAGNLIVFEGRRRLSGEPLKSLETTDLFILDRKAGTLDQLTKGIFDARAEGPTISGDGRYVGFVFRGRKGEMGGKGGVVIYDRVDNAWRRVAAGHCSRPSFSRDGSAIAFESDDKDIFPGARETITNIFVVKNPFKEPQP